MIDRDKVIDGTFVPENPVECMEAFVVASRLQADATKADVNAFAYVIMQGRSILIRWANNPPDKDAGVTFHALAASEFKEVMAGAAASGAVMGYDEKKDLSTFKQACREIARCMLNGKVDKATGLVPLLQIDDASGSYALASKGKVQGWNKKYIEDLEGAEEEKAAELRRKHQSKPENVEGSDDQAETTAGVGLDVFDDISGGAIIRGEVEELITTLVALACIAEKDGEGKETGLEKAVRHVKGWTRGLNKVLESDFEDVLNNTEVDESVNKVA